MGHMFLVSVIPYIVPFVAMIYPIAVTYRALKTAPKDPEAEDLSADDLEGEQRKDDLRCGLLDGHWTFTFRVTSLNSIHSCQDEGDVGLDHRGDLRGHAPPARRHGSRHVSPDGAGGRVLGLADAVPGMSIRYNTAERQRRPRAPIQ